MIIQERRILQSPYMEDITDADYVPAKGVCTKCRKKK